MIISDISSKIISELENQIQNSLLSGADFSTLAETIHASVNKLGISILEQVVSEGDRAVNDAPERKKHWQIVRKDTRSMLTAMGEAQISRTYFRHKGSGEHAYLLDKLLKLPSHDRIDTGLKANLIAQASNMSYAKAGVSNRFAAVSKQTVKNCLREAGALIHKPEKAAQRKVPVIYVEADEDHVAHQDGQNRQAKLVYVHEGAKRTGKRCALQNVHYFASTKAGAEAIWTEVLDYLEETYDLDHVKRIYVSGDGAAWIKAGAGYLPGSIPLLDRYHRNKYARKAAGGDDLLMRRLLEGLSAGDRRETAKILEACYERAHTDGHRKRVMEARKYFWSNWAGIENATKYPDALGCSAEGHVSHVLSERLSSRPMGWSLTGSDQMSRLRAFVWNGGDVLQTIKAEESKRFLTRRTEETIRKRLVGSIEKHGNIPVLQMAGRTNRTYTTMRGLQRGHWQFT